MCTPHLRRPVASDSVQSAARLCLCVLNWQVGCSKGCRALARGCAKARAWMGTGAGASASPWGAPTWRRRGSTRTRHTRTPRRPLPPPISPSASWCWWSSCSPICLLAPGTARTWRFGRGTMLAMALDAGWRPLGAGGCVVHGQSPAGWGARTRCALNARLHCSRACSEHGDTCVSLPVDSLQDLGWLPHARSACVAADGDGIVPLRARWQRRPRSRAPTTSCSARVTLWSS